MQCCSQPPENRFSRDKAQVIIGIGNQFLAFLRVDVLHRIYCDTKQSLNMPLHNSLLQSTL